MNELPRIEHFWIVEDEPAAAMAALGLSPEHVAACGRDDASAEAGRLAALGLPAPEFDPRLPVFQQAALAAGAVTAPCPWCGRPTASRESYCVFINAFDQPVFYRFQCCGEFFLLAAKSPQAKMALWLPRERALASFIEYRRAPHNHDYYGPGNFQEWFKLYATLAEREAGLVEAYRAAGGGSRAALACGFVFNHGHHVNDEISALHWLAGRGGLRNLPLLVGPFDFFQLADLFPGELASEPLRVPATGRETPPELFRRVLSEGLFATRLSYLGPFQEEAAARLLASARRKCASAFLARVEESRRHRPLVWITLRSHNRAWRSQADGLAQVCNALAREHPGLGVVFDGLERERSVLGDILPRLEPGVAAYDGLGTTVFEALAWASATDFFIAPHANGTIFTSIANKPGVAHSHEEWAFREPYCISRRENCALALPVTGRTIHEPGKDAFASDYELDWREVLDAARRLCG
ncbi:hypothetical protein M7784_01775 [Desulfovibrio aminophilus]|nr:hypothetical protein [Desulfovibrio aminophilus]MCM0753975.1 hypothetical protein [Desulfovibrio aminophilus]MDY0307932.1 hypothetical protein [Desulfovibrionaceae bacterium]